MIHVLLVIICVLLGVIIHKLKWLIDLSKINLHLVSPLKSNLTFIDAELKLIQEQTQRIIYIQKSDKFEEILTDYYEFQFNTNQSFNDLRNNLIEHMSLNENQKNYKILILKDYTKENG